MLVSKSLFHHQSALLVLSSAYHDSLPFSVCSDPAFLLYHIFSFAAEYFYLFSSAFLSYPTLYLFSLRGRFVPAQTALPG
jgi:hypothetical protein